MAASMATNPSKQGAYRPVTDPRVSVVFQILLLQNVTATK
jgi:hypothetical protein